MSYTFSLSSNFNGNLFAHQLYTNIDNSVSITKNIVGIDTNGDNVIITFDQELSGSEVTTLNNLVSSYTYVPLNRYRIDNMNPSYSVIGLTFTNINTSFYFDIENMTEILCVKVLGNITSNSYQVRLYDITNSKLMATGTFTNTTPVMNNLGTISNIPTTSSLLEVHVKSSSLLSTVTINKVIIYYR